MGKIIKIGNIRIGGKLPFVLIAGPCVIEDRALTLKIALAVKKNHVESERSICV